MVIREKEHRLYRQSFVPQASSGASTSASQLPLLLCFSHLRWSYVWQRPQQLMSRFTAHYRVIFVEEPIQAAGNFASTLSVQETDGVTVLTPLLPASQGGAGYGKQANETIRGLLTEWLSGRDSGRRPVVWYWTPLALGACPESLSNALIVFDAMDELSAFRFASEDLVRQEAALLRRADLVFTGGPSLYRARCARHPRVSCFPSGVDSAHYQQAVSKRKAPRMNALHLGYVGVLDERIDFDLIEQIADARPNWKISLVGPTAKIAPEAVPQRPNIVSHGMRPYDELPGLMATFDVGLLPLALNDATRFISPTKTLEYLAAGLPAVSTPVHDVVELYDDCVEIVDGVEEAVTAAERLAAATPADIAARARSARAHLVRRSWDATVAAMTELIERSARSESLAPPVAELTLAVAGSAD